jgi:hypothetical protein
MVKRHHHVFMCWHMKVGIDFETTKYKSLVAIEMAAASSTFCESDSYRGTNNPLLLMVYGDQVANAKIDTVACSIEVTWSEAN